jgi:hypothetical protein
VEVNIWIGTSDAGVFRIGHRAIAHFQAPALLSDNSVLSLLQDAE